MPLFWLLFLPAAFYQGLAISATIGQLWRRSHKPAEHPAGLPSVSVLKPVSGLDPNTAEAFRSQALQQYTNFELLFGVSDLADPAVPAIRELQSTYPDIPIRLIVCETVFPNRKVGVLKDLARHASHPVWVVNDGDICVTPSYLAAVVAPLTDDAVGVVTCPYRANAHSLPTGWEALGIATDFMPSGAVAQMLGVREFGFGSTLVFRSADLLAVGGFESLAAYLADDYQLVKRISGLGKRTVLSSYVVETSLGEDTWRGMWNHQLRWARTIRTSKGGGYAGLPITHAGSWAVLALALGLWPAACILLGLRIVSAYSSGALFLGSGVARAWGWCAPLWDCFASAVWLSSYFGRQVKWRNRVLTIGRNGLIKP